jgi:hypothetical protein
VPQSRKYLSDAERQAAFRRRRSNSVAALQAAKGLAPLPAIATIAGWQRWRQLLEQIDQALNEAHAQMESYSDARSQEWQDSDKADEFAERVAAVEELIDHVTECRSQIA